MKTILVVDDEPRTRNGIKKALEAWSAGLLNIHSFESAVKAIEWMKDHPVHLIITDIRMPEIGGLQMLEQMAERTPKPVVIVISGYAEFEYAQKAIQLGVVEYLLKPLDKLKLIESVEKALMLEKDRLRIERMEKIVDPKLMETNQEEAHYSQHVKDAIAYVDEHFTQPIGMKQVAEYLHMNASYFSVLFKEQTGFTFSDYLTRKRVQRAKELLAQTRMPVWEIAEKVGYQTAKYFIKVFKEKESVSPSQYRQHISDTVSNIQ